MNKGLSLGFEFLDIEIIDHKKEPELSNGKWNCDQCSLFFLNKEKLIEHKKKHLSAPEEALKCQYCNKTLSIKEESKECYSNRKCNTCEYKCSKCLQRFQRHSSLVNHEKNHLFLKKRKTISSKNKHVSGTELKKVANPNVSRKRHKEKIVPEQSQNFKRKGNEDVNIIAAISPKKMRRALPEPIPNENSGSDDANDTIQINDKTLKRQSATYIKTSENGENKQNNRTNMSLDSSNSHENIVNYKPFSCHVCGNNFASGNSLLDHIKSHGENVSKGFKCKHCGDEFDDIYKMQYHLAICPLAEDETTLVKNIPPKFHTTPSNGPPRKQGRPRKIRQESPNKNFDYDLTPSLGTRGSMKKKIKTDESSEFVSKSLSPKHSRPRRSKALKTKENSFTLLNEFVDSNCEEMNNYVSDHIEDDPLGDVAADNVNCPLNQSYESVEDDKTKVHLCPFPRCGIKFTREKALLCHMRNHNDDFEDSYKCHKCDIPFDDIHRLRSHLNECKDIKEENEENLSEPDDADDYNSTDKTFQTSQKKRGDFTCNICGRAHLSQEKLKRCLHNTTEHSKRMPPCRLCGENCDNEQILKKHFRSTHSKNLPFQCSICYTEFDTKTAESEHYLTHLESEDFECIICSLKLPTYKDLYFHYKQDHVTKRQSICKICNNIFPSESLLVKHICTHEGEHRRKCMFCQKSFSSNTSLNVHVKRHTNKKIYKCKICYRAFVDTGDLMKHMLFHASMTTGERPFQCCLCFVSYKQKPLLAAHITNSHLGKTLSDLKCPICGVILKDAKMMASHLMDHSFRISRKNMSKLEIKWLKQSGSGETLPLLPKRGRPRKLCNNSEKITTKLSQNLNSKKVLIKYNTRKKNPKINTEMLYVDDSSDEVTEPFNENFTNGNLSTMTKHKSRSSKRVSLCQLPKRESLRKLCDNNKKLTTKPPKVSENNKTSKIGLRKSNARKCYINSNTADLNDSSDINSNTADLNDSSDMNSNTADLNDSSDNPRSPVKSNLSKQSRANQREICPDESSRKLKTESPQKNNTTTKQRPMSFWMITPSCNQNNVKPLKSDKTPLQRTQRQTKLVNSLSHTVKEGLAGNCQDPSNVNTPSIVYSFENIKIENEEPKISPVSHSTKRVLNGDEHFSNYNNFKDENEYVAQYNDKNIIHYTEIKHEKSDCFIQEKKYFEPSLGLTKYSCTTCVLSFPSQEELLYHNTKHIL